MLILFIKKTFNLFSPLKPPDLFMAGRKAHLSTVIETSTPSL